MRKIIKAAWILGHVDGRHRLFKDSTLVIEDDRVVEVVATFDGHADETIDAGNSLVAPGFIDTHVHSGHRASHRLITDTGRPFYFGQPFLEISVPKRGKTVVGDPRYQAHGSQMANAALALNAEFTVAELLRNGVTTFVEFGSQLAMQEAMAVQCERLGARGYLGPGYDCGRWVGGDYGRLERDFDPAVGEAGLAKALSFAEEYDGKAGGLINAILVPREVETSTVELLTKTRDAAQERRLPIATHAAYSVLEFHDIVREHQMTPIELLDSIGLLGPMLNIGHGNFISDNPNLNYAMKRDLQLMGEAGVSISHCPINIVRRGRTLNDFGQYTKAGVNVTIGSDTYPRDMLMNMRQASYLGKIMSGSYFEATAGEVFESATVGGARSLGRDDLGRLAPGAKADLISIGLDGRGTLRMGPVYDPVRTVVECGVGDDVSMVMVDGKVVVKDGQVLGADLEKLRAAAQEAGEQVWETLHDWDPLGRHVDDACPLSYEPVCGCK